MKSTVLQFYVSEGWNPEFWKGSVRWEIIFRLSVGFLFSPTGPRPEERHLPGFQPSVLAIQYAVYVAS